MSDIRLTEGTAPATPPANTVTLYAKADGRFYFKADDGVEIPLKATGAGTGDVTKVGTPVNNELAVWTGDGTLEGESTLTYNSGSSTLSVLSVDNLAVITSHSSLGTKVTIPVGTNWIFQNDSAVTKFTIDEYGTFDAAGSATIDGNITLTGGATIQSTAAGNISITPDTTGSVVLDGLNWPQADGTANQVLKTDGVGQLSWTASGDVTKVGTPVDNEVGVWTGDGTLGGSSTFTKSNAQLIAGTMKFDIDQSIGAGQDNYVLTYDHATTEIRLEASAGGGGGGGLTPVFTNTNYTASAGEIVYVDCSGGAITITLPITPTGDDRVVVVDSTGDSDTNNITIGRNGETINGNASDFVIDAPFGQANLAYSGTGTDWKHALTAGTPTPTGEYKSVKNETGTTYDFVLSDVGRLITCNNAAAITATIPANASVAFPIGSRIDIMQLGAGQVTIAITTDTLNGNTKINAQYESVSITKIAATTWVVTGGVV